MFTKRKNDSAYRVTQNTTLLPFLMDVTHTTRNKAKSLLAHRQVSVNGIILTRHDSPIQPGNTVLVSAEKGNLELRHPKLRIVYEDDNLIVVEKKTGLITVPAHPGSSETTVFSILKNYVKKQNIRNGVYVVHRLDRETSGILLFVKSPELQQYMREYWRQLVTKRTYIAIVEGQLTKDQGQIKSWFTEDKRNAMVYSSPVDDGGDLAVTNYRVLKRNDNYSLVELNLETGRTNQIRVHMASIGHPVLGDRKYGHGNNLSPLDRLCLHAKVLEFTNPVNEKKTRFEVPEPREFIRFFTTAKSSVDTDK